MANDDQRNKCQHWFGIIDPYPDMPSGFILSDNSIYVSLTQKTEFNYCPKCGQCLHHNEGIDENSQDLCCMDCGEWL